MPGTVAAALPQLAILVELALDTLASGGRIHYFGAGAGGRIALGDALELAPTYGVGPETVCPHLAGGARAATEPVESAEDLAPLLDPGHLRRADLAVAVSASGRTRYVRDALAAARAAGAATALLSGDPRSPLAALVDLHIVLDTGPELVTGSTRMKAGTAQKLALNAFSTALMVRSGRTRAGRMVAASTSNEKLRARAVQTLSAVQEIGEQQAARLLDEYGGDLAAAVRADACKVQTRE